MIRFALVGALALLASAAQAQSCKDTVNARQLGFLRCAGEQARQLSSTSRAPSETIASAALVRCQQHQDAIISALVSTCGYDQSAAERGADEFVRSSRADAMQVLREGRPGRGLKPPHRRNGPADFSGI